MTTGFIYVNIDLRHQYGISVAESQTFLLTKRPPAAKRNVCRSQASSKGHCLSFLIGAFRSVLCVSVF